MGRKNKIRKMPTCYCLTLMCCQPCLPNFQCFQGWVSWTPSCIFSCCCVSNAVVSGTYLWVAVSQAWSKVISRLAEYDDVIRGAFLVLPRPPPNPKPTTGCTSEVYKYSTTSATVMAAAMTSSSSAVLSIERFTSAFARMVDEQMIALIQSRSLELHYQNF